MLDLAGMVKRLCISDSTIVTGPTDRHLGDGFAEVAVRVPSLNRLADELGWTPARSTEDIVRDVAVGTRGGG